MMPGERGDGVMGSRATVHTCPGYPHGQAPSEPWAQQSSARRAPGWEADMMGRGEGNAEAGGTKPALLIPPSDAPLPKPQSESTQGLGSEALKCLVSLALN